MSYKYNNTLRQLIIGESFVSTSKAENDRLATSDILPIACQFTSITALYYYIKAHNYVYIEINKSLIYLSARAILWYRAFEIYNRSSTFNLGAFSKTLLVAFALLRITL